MERKKIDGHYLTPSEMATEMTEVLGRQLSKKRKKKIVDLLNQLRWFSEDDISRCVAEFAKGEK